MPFYEYTCENCSYNFEELQKISDPPLTKCPRCGKNTLKRLIGAGAVIFKGSGFYITDYKNKPLQKTQTSVKTTGETPATEKKDLSSKNDVTKAETSSKGSAESKNNPE